MTTIGSPSSSAGVTASSSQRRRSPPSTVAPTLSPDLQNLLVQVQQDQHSVSLFSDLLTAATEYVNKGAAKQTHIYCSIGRPCDFDLESCMLRVLSFRNKDQVEFWRNRIFKAIYSNCIECYKGFLRAKDRLRSLYLSSFAQDKLDAFYAYVDSCEEQLAIDVLNKAKQMPGTPLKRLSRPEMYAVLTLIASPHAIKLNELLRDIVTTDELSNVQEVSAGLLTLSIDNDATLRTFAARQMLLLKPLPLEPLPPTVFMSAVDQVAQRYSQDGGTADWSLLSILLNAAPVVAPAMTASILSHVHDRHKRFADVLKAYATLLKLRGPAVWQDNDDADQEYATLILSGILDNPFFTNPLFDSAQTVNNQRERGLFFGWMRPHLDSLNQRGGKQFSEAIKRLANFLFERMQQGHVPNECRAVALTEGVDLVLNHADEVNSRQVVDLYASSIAHIALSHESKADLKTKQAAQQLISQAFERDSRNLGAALLKMSNMSSRNHSKLKAAIKASRDPNAANKVAQIGTPKSVYEKAALDDYPIVEICSVLWSETYSVTAASSSQKGVAILLSALAITTVYTPPSIATHLMRKPSGSDHPSYETYLAKVRSSLSSVAKAFATMRDNFAETITDFGEIAGEGEVQDLCTANAYSLLLLNLCPEPSIYRPAQNLLRVAFSSVETRSDCFRILFQLNNALSFRALGDYLRMFVNAANNLVEANNLAKWMVRSFADIVNVLAGSTDGILRPGTSWSLVEDKANLQNVALKAPSIWRLMCESVAVIFKRTPAWSNLLAREEMVAWFRDVTMFASEMVDALPVFCHLVRRAAEAPMSWPGKQKQSEDGKDPDAADEEAMTRALALPVEDAVSWLRMNDAEILHETQSFILKALDQFGSDHELPTQARDKMLHFVNEQMTIEDAQVRHTLLTLDELEDLKMRLDPEPGIIVISDEEDDSGYGGSDSATIQTHTSRASDKQSSDGHSNASVPKARTGGAASSFKDDTDKSHWWSGVGRVGITSSQEKQRKKLKQAKLSFSKVNPADIIDFDGDAEPDRARDIIKHDFTRAKVRSALPSAPINAYRGASSRLAGSSSSSSASRNNASTGKMAQLRQELGSTRTWKPQNVNARDTRWGRNHEDEVTVKAPAAVSSVTGTLINKMPPPTTEAAKAAARKAAGGRSDSTSSSESDSESSDDGTEAKGLAALRAQTDRPRTIKINQPQRRQIKVMEDPHLARARKERADAERKRMLRSPPDYSALHRSILAWNYYHEGDKPPAMAGKEPEYRRVQPHFGNATEYGSVFGPLLLLECWSQFHQAREEADTSSEPSLPIEIAGRSTVDQFVDVNITIAPDLLPPMFSIGETDIVRLKERGPAVAGKNSRIILAKVEAFKRHPQGHQATLRCCLTEDRQGASTALVNRSKWEFKKLFSLTTIHREFAALMAAPYFDLYGDIAKARVAPKATIAPDDLRKAMNGYQVNEPQARAILGSLATEGFSLIQGPPGTGKTKTICALIGAFVSNRKGPSTSVQAGHVAGKLNATKKILLCAPSNAAIDEVAKRAKVGVRLVDGKIIYPKVVRVGRDDSINVTVKDISLEHLIEQRLAGGSTHGNSDNSAPVDPSVLHVEIHTLKRQREDKIQEVSQNRGNKALVTQLEAEIRNLSAKRLAVMSRLDEAKDKAQSAYRQREADRRRARTEILGDADVICTTLSGAGHEMLSSLAFDFETVVIDEAAQAVELSTIIPLRYGCKQCIMVGDPNQLPPTVLSQQAERLGYSQSLFVRMFERSPAAVHLLSIQYRMHPEIAMFPSQTFYEGKLQNGPNMAELTRQPWHSTELMRPFKFLSTKTPEMPGRMHSIINKEEANVALALYERLRVDYPAIDFDYRIGIVTMYKAQVFELRRTFQNRYGQDIIQRIDFNTVDGFQGQEKDIIILSCVRSSNEPRSIGFLSDRRRLNVAVTRAKSNLFIIGNAEHLKRSDSLWHTLVTTAERCGALQTASVSLLQKGAKSLAGGMKIEKQDSSFMPFTKKSVTPKTAFSPKPEPVSARKASTAVSPSRPAPTTPVALAKGKHTPIPHDSKRKSIIVNDDPITARKRNKTDSEADDFNIVESSTSAGQGSRPPKNHVVPMKPPRLSNGATGANGVSGNDKERPANKPRTPIEPGRNLSVGVLKRPPTPTNTAPASAPTRASPSTNNVPRAPAPDQRRRAVSPSKPSNAALNALFVKKRK